MASSKSLSTRIKESIEIRSRMKAFGLEKFKELAPFIEAMNEHVKTGKRCVGSIYMVSAGRVFRFWLEDAEGCESRIVVGGCDEVGEEPHPDEPRESVGTRKLASIPE